MIYIKLYLRVLIINILVDIVCPLENENNLSWMYLPQI